VDEVSREDVVPEDSKPARERDVLEKMITNTTRFRTYTREPETGLSPHLKKFPNMQRSMPSR
jgi:hypothetical protein